MKKIFTILVVALMSMSAMAGEHEIGAIVGGLNGISYKYWMTDELAVQADLAVGLTQAADGYKDNGGTYHISSWGMYDFTLNPNALYHIALPADFYAYAGAGASIGFMSYLKQLELVDRNPIDGKFGANVVVGAEYKLSGVPLSFSLDFRPGYGLRFNTYTNDYVRYTDLHHFFDWKLGLAVRYCL